MVRSRVGKLVTVFLSAYLWRYHLASEADQIDSIRATPRLSFVGLSLLTLLSRLDPLDTCVRSRALKRVLPLWQLWPLSCSSVVDVAINQNPKNK